MIPTSSLIPLPWSFITKEHSPALEEALEEEGAVFQVALNLVTASLQVTAHTETDANSHMMVRRQQTPTHQGELSAVEEVLLRSLALHSKRVAAWLATRAHTHTTQRITPVVSAEEVFKRSLALHGKRAIACQATLAHTPTTQRTTPAPIALSTTRNLALRGKTMEPAIAVILVPSLTALQVVPQAVCLAHRMLPLAHLPPLSPLSVGFGQVGLWARVWVWASAREWEL
jgi:hypothetical protein